MFILVRRTLCLALIGAIAFLVVALWSGGKELRKLGRETGGAIRKGSERLAEKADRIKEKRDTTTSTIKRWTGKESSGGGKGSPEEEDRTDMKATQKVERKKEPQDSGAGDGEAPGKGDTSSGERGFFRTLMDTAWAKVWKFVREKVSADERPHTS